MKTSQLGMESEIDELDEGNPQRRISQLGWSSAEGHMQDENAKLIAERLGRAMDGLHAELKEIRQGQEHLCVLTNQRLQHLEKNIADHEERIRRNTDGITRYSVATGGSGLVSLVAIIKSFLGSFSP